MFHVEQMAMERLPACPLCQGEGPFSHWVGAKDTLVSGEWFHVEQCRECGLLFTHPRPNPQEISSFYRVSDYLSHDEAARGWLAWMYARVRRRMILLKIKWLKGFLAGEAEEGEGGRDGRNRDGRNRDGRSRYGRNLGGRNRGWRNRTPSQASANKGNAPGGHLLDMGCGTGAFARAVKELTGMEAMGYEPAAEASRLAREKGLEVMQTQEELEALADGHFQCITYWHVLEHAHDFAGALAQARRLLADDGILAVAVPIHQSADARFYGKHWAAYDLPRHLFHFGRETLTRAASQAGFRLLGRRGLTFDSYYVALLSEKNHRERHGPAAVLRALVVATWSNAQAALGFKPWSSEVFFFAKTPGPPQP